MACKAEILSTELSLPNKRKICVSTLYRVGTLGMNNFFEVHQYYTELCKKHKYKQVYIIGDSNLESVNWNTFSSTNSIHSHFLDLFQDLGLTQLVSSPTHKQGNVLDILLTDSPQLLRNLDIHDPGEFIKSDHSPITFNINVKLEKKKVQKRFIFNYKKANWSNLNKDLARVDWDHLLNHNDIHVSWECFKSKFLCLCDKHIPKISVTDGYQPPWFNAEVFRLSKKKEHVRKLYKISKNYGHYRKYSTLRKELKLLIKSKMKSNFDDDLSPKIISKKFWSYIKSCTKSNRLPDKMYLKDRTRNTREGIANLFNEHFQNRFSDCSRYDIGIDFTNDQSNYLTITSDTIFKLLRKLNPNKSQDPDKISGHLLKGCAPSIAIPLKILFNLSYSTGSLP